MIFLETDATSSAPEGSTAACSSGSATRTCLAACLLFALAACGRHEATKPIQHTPENTVAGANTYTAADVLTAFKAAYGQPAPLQGKDENGDTITYNPVSLIDVAPEMVALLVKGEIPDGCHACSGAVSIFYMRRNGKDFELLGKWPDIAGKAEFGQAADWTERNDLSRYPGLLFTSTGGGQGCQITSSDLVEMRPTRPILRFQNVVTALDYDPGEDTNTPAEKLEGIITRDRPNHSLKVVYRGTANFILRFFQDGDSWEPDPTKHAAPSC